MIVAGIDFETTSVDKDTCYATELALILWESETNKIIEPMSFLLELPAEIEVTNEDITGISKRMTQTYGYRWKEVQAYVLQRLVYADYLMAHNVEFDRTILKRMFNWDSHYGEKPFDDDHWIDTMTDVPYPPTIRTRSLPYLAAEHGFVNPFPHRALFDVATMIKIVGLYDFKVILKYADSPNMWIRATVSFDDKQLAKDRHFRWDPENKFWVKQVKEINLDNEEEQADFPIDLLPGYEYKEKYS
ncbi:3'-5' exonuclease [bacterium]|nr:3'-5' exonuclease [bacterium]